MIEIRNLRTLLGPVSRRVSLMVSRAVIALVDDALKCQAVQLQALHGEVLQNVERFQEYGFTSNPQVGAEAVLVSVAGNRSHCIVVGTVDRRYRLTALQSGEVAIHDDLGQKVHLTRSGIVILGAGLPISISGAPQVTVTGGDVIADGISLKTHVHGGVMAGGADTGAPV